MKKLSCAALLLISFCVYAQNRSSLNEFNGRPATGRTTAPATIASLVEGWKKDEGFFNFYYDEKSGRVLLEINKDQLDKEILYFSSLSSGVGNGIERGQSSSGIAKFVKVANKVMLIEPNYSYRAVTDNADEKNAVDNAFAKSVIWGFVPLAYEDG